MSPLVSRWFDVLRRSRSSAAARACAARAIAAAAFALAVLLPLRASAAIVPACEPDAATWMPVAVESSCDTDENPIANGVAAPICDPDGASAVAPPRLLPIPDARIEAAPACDAASVSPMVGPRGNDHPAITSPAIIDHATLTGGLFVPPAPLLACVDAPDPAGGPRAGVADDVYHPPR
jgi:hypothetical protein